MTARLARKGPSPGLGGALRGGARERRTPGAPERAPPGARGDDRGRVAGCRRSHARASAHARTHAPAPVPSPFADSVFLTRIPAPRGKPRCLKTDVPSSSKRWPVTRVSPQSPRLGRDSPTPQHLRGKAGACGPWGPRHQRAGAFWAHRRQALVNPGTMPPVPARGTRVSVGLLEAEEHTAENPENRGRPAPGADPDPGPGAFEPVTESAGD